ncbi:MAG: methyltransferase domain-containing protein [Actinobacteria bacterium]|nr:methyltransferase domain-containing protein [Actinomycetota bacterium]
MSRRRPLSETYDRAYYDHWYRREGFGSPARLRRKVNYALGAAEYLLERPVRSVLDVGCGEGPWRVELAKQRPKARYLGIDPSEYAIERHGKKRNLRLGGMGDLLGMNLHEEGPFDLVVCVDVIAYVAAAELRSGLRVMASVMSGVALIEVFTAADDFEGDRHGYHARSPRTYDRWFADAGLRRIGPHLYIPEIALPQLATFEYRH